MPLRYLNRSNSSTTISAGNSVLFNGSNQYLTTANVSNFVLTGDFTTECFVNLSALPTTQKAIINYWNAASNNRSIYWNLINSGGAVTMSFGLSGNGTSANSLSIDNGWNPALNTWYHIAVSRKSNIATMFVDGTQLGTTQSLSISNKSVAAPLAIGADYPLLSAAYYFNGYISNLRIVNGTAVYTASFTAPTSPLTSVASCSLLTCNAATIVDSSNNNFTITNNGAATVSSTVPFTASFAPAPSGMKFGNRNNSGAPVPTGKSVQFNGSNQYLSVANNAAFDFGTGDFTIELWFMLTADASLNNGGTRDAAFIAAFEQSGALITDWAFGVGGDATTTGTNLSFGARQSSTQQTVAYTNTITKNVWHHTALTRTGNTMSLYYDGVRAGQNTNFTIASNTGGNSISIGALRYAGYLQYFPGYISNVRVVKGGVVYTGTTYAVPTAPLTAIANTSLLTCNAATIVDGSSNNFTITNNNSATVSSITPFTVASAASTTRVRKVYADAVSSIITSGLVLNLDASNASSYPGSGTSWFDLSGNGNTGTLVNGVGYNSANGGALTFDGVNDFVRITLPSTTSYNTFTYNSWIYSTSDSGYRTIIDQDNDDWALFSFDGQLISYDPNFSSGYTLNLNQWYNVVMSHADGGPVLFYVNGSLVYTSSNTSINHTTSYFGIGAGIINPTTADECWSGRIAQASIYNRALSASEVLQNYNITKAKFGL